MWHLRQDLENLLTSSDKWDRKSGSGRGESKCGGGPDVGKSLATVRVDRWPWGQMSLKRRVRAYCGVFKTMLRSLHIILRATGSP